MNHLFLRGVLAFMWVLFACVVIGIGSSFAAGMPAATIEQPMMLVGTWAKDGDKKNPELRIDYNQASGKYDFFQLKKSEWVKFAELEEKELPNEWLIKSKDGNFYLGTPAVNLGLKKVDK